MVVGVRKLESQWSDDEKKAANLDQCLKSLIMSDFQDSFNDEEDTRSNQEYMNNQEMEFHKRALLAKSKRFFKKGNQRIFSHDQAQCPKKVSVPPTVITHMVGTLTVEKTNDGFQTVGKKKKKKGKTKSTNGGQFGGHSVKQSVRYEPKATSVPTKEVTNPGNASTSSSMLKNQTQVTIASNKDGSITMSNSYAALDDESEEDVENVYDKSANLLHGTQTGESSSTFTVAAG
ncbi:hypothetical protein Tco_0013803 [Tanacetum coccineum]